MVTFIVVFIWIVLAWKLGKWGKISEMSPTILFFITFNLLYNILYFNQYLWKYESTSHYLGHNSIALLFIYITVPCTIIVFLSYLPKKKPYGYLVFWITLYSIIEFVMSKLDLFSYHRGWSMKWSILFNIIMFSLFAIHFRRPLIAVTVSIIIMIGLLLLFPPSFERMV